MNAILNHRHHGVHTAIRIFALPPGRRFIRRRGDEPLVFERNLLSVLPSGFLPVPAAKILLAVGDGRTGATTVSRPQLFRPWAKYFDAYSLEISP